MQEKRTSSFEDACKYPCDIMAAVIEMEHRTTGRSRADCLKVVGETMADMLEEYRDMSDIALARKSMTIEASVITGMSPEKQASVMLDALANEFGGDDNVM